MSPKDLTGYYWAKLDKSLRHLEYSFKKVTGMPSDASKMSEEELETWESFGSRFSRSSDLFLTKVIKAFVLRDDPAFDGSFRDLLNRAEKLGWIESVPVWMQIRELRNGVVHDYNDEDLSAYFEKLRELSPLLLDLRKRRIDAAQPG